MLIFRLFLIFTIFISTSSWDVSYIFLFPKDPQFILTGLIFFLSLHLKYYFMDMNFTEEFMDSLKKMNMHQTWWYKTYEVFTDKIPKFFKNIWFFRKQLWEHREWDYSFSLMMFKRSLESLCYDLEHYGHEVDGTRMKKVEKIKRVIYLLNNIRTDNYINMAEEEMGTLYDSGFEFEPTDNGNFRMVNTLTEFQNTHNRKVYHLAEKIEKDEWKELWKILEGQDVEEYRNLFDSKTDEEKRERDIWNEWFDGSGMKHWWD